MKLSYTKHTYTVIALFMVSENPRRVLTFVSPVEAAFFMGCKSIAFIGF